MSEQPQFWQSAEHGLLYEAGAQAGWGIFRLPAGHFLHNAAQPHDGHYSAAERGEIERTAENKARADVIFFNVAHLDAQHIAHQHDPIDWEQYAKNLTDLCLAYLAIRSPVGVLAWET